MSSHLTTARILSGSSLRRVALPLLPLLIFAGLLSCARGQAVREDPAAYSYAYAYAGSERCRECHAEKYKGWSETFHSTVVQDAKKQPEAVLGDFSNPQLPFTLDDVAYTIGGHKVQRYLKRIEDDFYVLPRSWSVQSQEWQNSGRGDFFWRKEPYSQYCKGCHVTAYDPQANVPYAELRVGCEACHGPGRGHAESGGEAAVVHPGKLSEGRRNMICAACHVRGKDVTDTYYFPIGFIPGEDLGAYYVPHQKPAEETNFQAILREFDLWKEQREKQEGVACDICEIPGKRIESKTGIDYCFECHDFRSEKRDRYPEHTQHPATVELDCSDCHRQKTTDIVNPGNHDIHSYGYFLLHAEKCYDPLVYKACAACHDERGREWARQTVERWREPVKLDH